MSALPSRRTCAVHEPMSANEPRVRFGSEALGQQRTMGFVLSPSEKSGLFLHLISLFCANYSLETSNAKDFRWLSLRGSALRVQCRTIGHGNLPLHPLSKSVWLGILGECRRSSAEFDVAGTKSRVLCGQRRERETTFAKVLQKLWVITCDRNGGAAGSNNYQGRQSRR
jgi:hypothetical protein